MSERKRKFSDLFWALAMFSFACEAFVTSFQLAPTWTAMFDTHSPAWWPQVAGAFIMTRASQFAAKYFGEDP